MILSSQTDANDAEQMLQFYKKNFATVDVVHCLKCESILAFECAGGDGMGIAPNEMGKYVIPVGDKLISHRVRLDETPTGERMVGYQCECGNDTRIAEAERGMVPVGKFQSSLSPFEKHQIADKIRGDKKYKVKFKKQGNRKIMETFAVERV